MDPMSKKSKKSDEEKVRRDVTSGLKSVRDLLMAFLKMTKKLGKGIRRPTTTFRVNRSESTSSSASPEASSNDSDPKLTVSK